MKVKLIVENPVEVELKCKLLDIKIYEQQRISTKKTGLLIGVQKTSDLYELGLLVGQITVGDVQAE